MQSLMEGIVSMRPVVVVAVALGITGAALADGRHGEDADPGGQGENRGSGAKHDAHWISPPAAARRANPVTRDSGSVGRGASLFAANCAACHGKDAAGDGPAGVALNPRPPDLRRMSGVHPDGDFAWKIANGRGAMPAWKNTLEERQIWDLTNYIQSLSERGLSPPGGAGRQQEAHSGGEHPRGGAT